MADVTPGNKYVERAYLSICTYCQQAVDIRDDDVMRRVLAWMDVPTPQIGPAALPTLINEWGHQRCVVERAQQRADQLRQMGEAGDRRVTRRGRRTP